MSLSTQSPPMENSPQDNNEQMSLGAKLASMENSLQDNNQQMSLSAKLASMANTLREIQSEFKTNGANTYSSSTTSQTMSPAGTQRFSKQTNITDGTGKETTVETSLNAKGQGKQCTKQKTLRDGKIIDTSQSCQKVQKKIQRGQQQNSPGQQQNLRGQQVDPIGQQQNPPEQQVDPIEQKQKRKIQTQDQKKTNITSQDDDFFSLPQ